MTPKSVTFILSVDTEEEWDWSGPFPDNDFSVENIKEIPAFQNACQEVGIKPTYLVDYVVANNSKAVEILNTLNKKQCEIGAHLHPWTNPPFFSETSEFLSHVVNLPVDHVEAKLIELKKIIENNLGSSPKTFRTGRWGISGPVLELLTKYGIDTDPSIYPLYRNDYFSCESAPSTPYWPSLADTNQAGEQRDIFEIPVTSGFNRNNYPFAQKIHILMEKPPFRWFRINSMLWHSLLLRKLYLCPEMCSSKDMKRLIDVGLKRGQRVFHMYLHSSSLLDNITGLNQEANARENICKRIAEVSGYLQSKSEVTFSTMSEARSALTGEQQ